MKLLTFLINWIVSLLWHQLFLFLCHSLSPQLLFRRYGWSKALFISPHYRYLAQKYNFDDYSSKGSSVHSIKKYNRNVMANMAAIEGPASESMAVTGEQTVGCSSPVAVRCNFCQLELCTCRH